MPVQPSSEQVQKLTTQVEQLRQHLKVDRMKMRGTLEKLTKFCLERQLEDPLLYSVKDNPFKEKRSCAIV